MAALKRPLRHKSIRSPISFLLLALFGCHPAVRGENEQNQPTGTQSLISITDNRELSPVNRDQIATNGASARIWLDGDRIVRFAAERAHYLVQALPRSSRRLFDSMDRVSLSLEVTENGLAGSITAPRSSLLVLPVRRTVSAVRIGRRSLPLAEFISEPTLGNVRLSIPAGRHALSIVYEKSDQDLAEGWPRDLKYSYLSSPAVADLDGDGRPEIILGSGKTEKNMLVLHADGSSAPGWPQGTPGEIASSPAVGDIDGDGDAEVVVGSYGKYDSKERLYEGWVHAWHRDGRPVEGWPVRAGWGIESTPALADLNGDGRLDIVIGSTDRKVYAWNGNGSSLAGWPQETGGIVTSSPAVGDADGDGNPEVFIGSGDGRVYAWDADGRAKPGWPFTTGLSIESSPVLVDLDGDGKFEVVTGSNDGAVYALSADGKLLPGWPQKTGDIVRSSPAVGDLDGDGRPEIVVGSYDRKVYVWHTDGRAAKGWPRQTGWLVKSSPILADLDGDTRPEVVVGSHDGRLWAWHANGERVSGWPKTTLLMNIASPVAGDIDGDGNVEIFSAALNIYHGKLFCWNCPGKWDRRRSPWPMFRGNLRRTGVLDPEGLKR